MVFKATLDIVESDTQISNAILKALEPQANRYFQKVFDKTKNKILELVISAIKSQPEYDALLSGQLKAEFGLPDSVSRVNDIIDVWTNSIDIIYQPVKIKSNTLQASFSISMIRSDFSDVLSSESASLQTTKGSTLNWLEWLLLFGNKTIIKDYEIEFGSFPQSRTGMAIMKGSSKSKWAVPPEYSGTLNNNWITRAIDSVDSTINNLLNKNIKI